jgi:hypothetical protein
MDRRTVPPIFARAPNDYDPIYFNDLVRALTSLVIYIQTPGEGRQTTIVLTNLQTDDYGLEPGTTFQVEGALRVAVLYRPYVRGVSASGSVGSVTVTV